jgi:hypothetical protein
MGNCEVDKAEAPTIFKEWTYQVKAMICHTADIVRLENRCLGWKIAVDLLHKGHNILLLFARGVDITQIYNLRMSASHYENPASVVVLRVSVLFLFISGVPRLLASVDGVLWDTGLVSRTLALPRLDYTLVDLRNVLLWDEVRGIVIDGPITCRTEMPIAEAAVSAKLDIAPTIKKSEKI